MTSATASCEVRTGDSSSTRQRVADKRDVLLTEIRQALHLKAGDSIVFDVENEGVQLRKAQSIDIEFNKALSATLSEWSSVADEEAYRDL